MTLDLNIFTGDFIRWLYVWYRKSLDILVIIQYISNMILLVSFAYKMVGSSVTMYTKANSSNDSELFQAAIYICNEFKYRIVSRCDGNGSRHDHFFICRYLQLHNITFTISSWLSSSVTKVLFNFPYHFCSS